MTGGGPGYEKYELDPASPRPSELLLAPRKERIEQVLKGRTRTLTVVLDQLEDAFNMAAVLRTSEAFGLQEVHVVKNPEVAFRPNETVTQGCDKWLDIERYDSFEQCARALKQRGFAICVSSADEKARPLWELSFAEPTALVFGNERHGVSADALAHADARFWLPMRGFVQSLNISAAVSATLSRAISWRLERGIVGDLSSSQSDELRETFERLSVKQRHKLYPK